MRRIIALIRLLAIVAAAVWRHRKAEGLSEYPPYNRPGWQSRKLYRDPVRELRDEDCIPY